LGYCSGFETPGYIKGSGMGFGRGYGRDRGWRGRGWGYGWRSGPEPFFYPSEAPSYPAPLSQEEESKYLEQSLTNLKKEIKIIEKRLEELALDKKDQ
jgi:hypothetical protein